MSNEVWVVAETLRGEIQEITHVMLAAGRQLARSLHSQMTTLVMGRDAQTLATHLGAADRVVCIDHADLSEFNPEAFLRVIAAILQQDPPRVVMFGHTATGTDLACGVAHQLGCPIVTSCRTFPSENAEPRYSSLICGGKIIAEGSLPAPTCVVTVMPGGYRAEEGKCNGSPKVEVRPAPVKLDGVRTRLKGYVEPPAGDVDIVKESILVSVGRGIQTKDNITLAEDLASALGGVVTGSRPVVDQEWLPTTRLVGKSGKQVKPKLYLALGISGAPEHAEGMREAEFIVAVNRDEKAPIYGFAHVGTTVDVLELLPALTSRIKQARGA